MIFLILSLLFATLSNHSGITVILSLLFLLPYVLLLFRTKVVFPKFYWFLACVIFVIISGLLFLVNIPKYKIAPEFNYAFTNNFIKYIILIILLYLFSLVLRNRKQQLINACEWVLRIHITVFYIQFLIAYSTGYYLDFVQPFIGEASRFQFYGVSSSLNLFRCTGLFIEPSTYAVSVYALYMAVNIKCNRHSKKLERFALLSIFLSLSTISLLILFLHFFVKLAPKFIDVKKAIVILIVISISAIGVSQTTLYEIQVEKLQNTSGIRFGLVEAVLNRNENLLIFGTGLYGVEDEIIEGSKGFCPAGTDCGAQINRKYASPADSGLIFYLFIKFGFLTIPILFCVVYPFILSFQRIGMFGILLFTKIQFAFPLIWVLVLLLREKDEKNNSGYAMASSRRC